MLRLFCRFAWNKANYLFILLLLSSFFYFYTVYYQSSSKATTLITFPSSTSLAKLNNRTHDFRLYPESRSFIEHSRIQIDHAPQTMFDFDPNQFDQTMDYTKPLQYSEAKFRSASVPIIWLDQHGDVRWNRAAQHEMLGHLLEKQFPNDDASTCLTRQLIVLEQWPMGFFSRHHCLIEHFGQTLYSPSMALLQPRRLSVSNAALEDYRNEGILRYYHSISLCSAYLHLPALQQLEHDLRSTIFRPTNVKTVNSITQWLERDESTVRFKFSREIWKFGYDHVPHRRWLFDRDRKEVKNNVRYDSPIPLLIDHSNEHIYHFEGTSLNLTTWLPRNIPQGPPKEVLPGTTTKRTIYDEIFSSFLRYMVLLFLSPLAPRIQTSAKLLAHHWSEYISDKYNQPYNESLSKMAVLFIRRGDKMPEDSFWQKHQRWRNISMYVKGIVDEEKRRRIRYSPIFVMTDDLSVMQSIQEYAAVGLTKSNKDESYAREHLYRRQIIYNVFAPQACFDPFVRIGFDQFLVNVQFVNDYAALVVGHTDSNVGRYLEEIIYVNRQLNPNTQTTTHVINAPDSLE